MRSTTILLAACALVTGLAGCAGRSAGPKPAASAAPAAAVPADSKLALVQVGMPPEEVEKLLGPPTSRNAYVTGKAFIPWYFGPDQTRTGWFYQGLGRVVFSGTGAWGTASRVQRVEYDATEDGRP